MSGNFRCVGGVQVFAIYGTYRFRDRHFLAYGLEFVGGRGGAVLAIPGHPRWRWTRRLLAVRGRTAEELLGKLLPIMDVRLVWLSSPYWGHVGPDRQISILNNDANDYGESGRT